jgi:L-fuculose-phosphate aldolase
VFALIPSKVSNVLARQIIEVGRWLVETGLTDGTSGNVSVRCPDGVTALITPSGRDYRLLTKRDLVRIHLGSGKAVGRLKPSSEWQLHRAIYQARPDVGAIIHHHATWASAVAVARKTIPVLIDEAADIGPIPTAPYAPSATQKLAEAISLELVKGINAVLLANHGAVAVGRDLKEASRRALEVERLAKIYIGAELLGGAYALNQAEIAMSREFFETYRAAPEERRRLLPTLRGVARPAGLSHLLSYGIQASATVASLLQNLVLQKLHR